LLAVVVWSRDVSGVHCAKVVSNVPAPHDHSQQNQAPPHAVLNYSLVLLMKGIIMPETC